MPGGCATTTTPPASPTTRQASGSTASWRPSPCCKGLFADGPLTFKGEHYQVTELDGRPKPVQRPWPPILVGGGGRRVLGIAAREADIVGINGTLTAGAVDPGALATMSAAAVDEKVAWVREAAGDRLG